MPVCIATLIPGHETGGNPSRAFITISVGRFMVDIDIHSDDAGYMAEELNDFLHHHGNGTLGIFDREMEETKREIPHIRGFSRYDEIVKSILEGGFPAYDTPTIACFGASEKISATPENIVKAIQWCMANQNFMKSPEGV